MKNFVLALSICGLALVGCGPQENDGTRQNTVSAAGDGGVTVQPEGYRGGNTTVTHPEGYRGGSTTYTAYNAHKTVLGTQVDCPGGNWIYIYHSAWFGDPTNPYWINFNVSTPSGNGGRVITRVCTYKYGCQNCYDKSPYSGADTTTLSITNNGGPGMPVTVSAFGSTQNWVTDDAYDWQCQSYNGCAD